MTDSKVEIDQENAEWLEQMDVDSEEFLSTLVEAHFVLRRFLGRDPPADLVYKLADAKVGDGQ